MKSLVCFKKCFVQKYFVTQLHQHLLQTSRAHEQGYPLPFSAKSSVSPVLLSLISQGKYGYDSTACPNNTLLLSPKPLVECKAPPSQDLCVPSDQLAPAAGSRCEVWRAKGLKSSKEGDCCCLVPMDCVPG